MEMTQNVVWRENALALLSNDVSGVSDTFIALGDTLYKSGWIEAAHTW